MNLTNNINIMQDFQYAINIAYDIYSDDKLKNYIDNLNDHTFYDNYSEMFRIKRNTPII